MSDRNLRMDEVRIRMGGVSKKTIYRAVQRGTLPKPYKLLGGNLNVWLESEIEEHLQRQKEAA